MRKGAKTGLIAGGAAVLALTGTVPAALAGGGGPSVSVRPGLAWPGLPATVTGSGFQAGQPVVLSFDGARLGRVTAGGAGGFTGRVTVPSTAKPGGHRLVAAQGSRSAATTVQARLQWTQLGLYASHRGANWYEHRLSPATVGQTVPLFPGSLQDTPPQAGMVLAKGVLVYGTRHGAVGVSAVTGKAVWTYDDPDLQLSGVAYDVDTGNVYLTGPSSLDLFAIDALTGRVAWSINFSGTSGGQGLTLAHGLLYVVAGDPAAGVNEVQAIDVATRTVRWRAPIERTVATPVLYNGVIYVVGLNLSAYSADTGHALWSVPISATDPEVGGGMPAADAGGVAVGSSDGRTRLYDLASGRQLWATEPLGGPAARVRSLAIAEGRVYADYDYNTYALDETNGSTVWSKTGGGVGLTYANGLLLGAITDPGGVDGRTAVVAATGEVKAVFPVQSGSFAPSIVADGTIYFGDNGISAYTLPAGLGGTPTK